MTLAKDFLEPYFRLHMLQVLRLFVGSSPERMYHAEFELGLFHEVSP